MKKLVACLLAVAMVASVAPAISVDAKTTNKSKENAVTYVEKGSKKKTKVVYKSTNPDVHNNIIKIKY